MEKLPQKILVTIVLLFDEYANPPRPRYNPGFSHPDPRSMDAPIIPTKKMIKRKLFMQFSQISTFRS